jgi:hypothetical protein
MSRQDGNGAMWAWFDAIMAALFNVLFSLACLCLIMYAR